MKRAMLLIAALLTDASYAQELNDPMRPPMALMESQGDASAPSAPVLQSVIVGAERRYAIIDGERVTTGSRFRDTRVVQIADNQVVLRDANGDTVLKLYPQVQKLIAAPTGRTAPQAERGKQ